MKLLFLVFDRIPRNVPEYQIPALQQGQEVWYRIVW